jgi:hypothetical protein
MDTTEGKVYKNLESALGAGVRRENLIQEYIDNALKDICAIRDKAAEDLDRKDYRYFMTLLKEELGE